mmetsp:Transcript_52936/g.146617  ORF Transcript_52936/g.146617 Transcript_52936/m.146617 type:complete len:197 (-) Transcript_52936:84-674(-)
MEERPAEEPLVELLVVGDFGVGKSAFATRFADDTFSEVCSSTVGLDVKTCMRVVGGRECKLKLWEISGGERFRIVMMGYYRRMQGIVVVYSVDDRASFENARRWVQEIDDHDGPEPRRRLLLGHKSDLASERVVAPEDGDRLAAELGVPFAEASSRSGEGVEASVQRLAAEILTAPRAPVQATRLGRGGRSGVCWR